MSLNNQTKYKIKTYLQDLFEDNQEKVEEKERSRGREVNMAINKDIPDKLSLVSFYQKNIYAQFLHPEIMRRILLVFDINNFTAEKQQISKEQYVSLICFLQYSYSLGKQQLSKYWTKIIDYQDKVKLPISELRKCLEMLVNGKLINGDNLISQKYEEEVIGNLKEKNCIIVEETA